MQNKVIKIYILLGVCIMENVRKIIMLVDDSNFNLTIGKDVLKDKYDVYTLHSGGELLHVIQKKIPDLILLDIEMPGMNGYDVIKKLKKNRLTMDIPVIFLTTLADNQNELKGLSLGAVDYIMKPFSPKLLLKRIETHLLVSEQQKEMKYYNKNLQKIIYEKTKDIYKLQNALLKTVTEMVEFRDDITGGHIERTQDYIKLLLRKMISRGIYKDITMEWSLNFLLQSSQLHDVGKIGIPDSILMKPGKLTEEEYNTMKTHTTLGVSILEKIECTTNEHDFFKYAKIFAGTHHEKWNGTGYPNGLKGEEIPLQGRLMAIADVYDALISERPYKEPFDHEVAVEIIKKGSGTDFDPVLVELFMEFSDEFLVMSRRSTSIPAHA